ncbi:MAG TPA: carboxypeptidase regulatory-like domain-containing protein, partial [Desulfocapsa sulfexigens]|nr:carboxypeptidase regulatory-like domain-containing protein [Desulfocapsa sulfexigens]
DATIRILNIVPRYQAGMELDAGSYKVEVSQTGYVTKTRIVEPAAGEDVTVPVHLEKISVSSGPLQGDSWREPITGMEFVYVKGDCYQMGSSLSEKGRDGDGKLHEVCPRKLNGNMRCNSNIT